MTEQITTPTIQPGETNQIFAYRILLESILTFKLPPGFIINEFQLSEKLQISRTPIREALLQLKKERLVEVFPQSSSKISLIDLEVIRQGSLTRRLLEQSLCKSLFYRLDEEFILQFKENLYEQKISAEQQDHDRFYHLDNEFHEIIYRASSKTNIFQACRLLSRQFDRLRYLVLTEKHSKISQFYEEHKNIYNHLVTGSEENFTQIYDEHLTEHQKNIADLIEKFPQYFADRKGTVIL